MDGSRRARWQASVDRSMQIQARIYLAVYAIMTVIVVYRIVLGHVNPLWAVFGFGIGIGLGFLLSRTKKLSYEESADRVMGSSHLVGILILVAYFVFIVFFRDQFIGRWVSDPETIGVVALSMTAGTMLSRIFFTVRSVQAVLSLAGISRESAT